MAHLIIQMKNGGNKRVVNLRRAETLVGRGANCQVRFPADDIRISREHARITRDQSGYWIENKSKNSTGLNGGIVNERMPLRQGDRIVICDYELLFEDDPDEPLPAPRHQIVARFRDHSIQSLAVDGRLPAVLDSCRIACQNTLRQADLLDKIGPMLKSVFPAAETVGVLLQRASAPGKIRVEVCFPLEGRATALEPDASIAKNCLDTRDGLLCVQLGETNEDESAVPNGSAMAVPLKAGETGSLGALWLAAATKCFTGHDVQMLYWLADFLASALENGRIHETAIADALRAGDNKIARRIQTEFLPRKPPLINGYTFFHYYEPALSVGGDYYDYIWLPGRRLAVLVADVAGKGVPAALLMSRLSAEARYCLTANSGNLAKAVGQLNMGLSEVLGDRFVTLAVCLLTPALHRVEIVCAGHEPPRILRAGSQNLETAIDLAITGSALGFVQDETYVAHQVRLDPGDNLLLFTDGVTDARDSVGKSFGIVQLLNVPLRNLAAHRQGVSATSLGQSVINEVTDHIADHPQFDDITLVCFGRERDNATDSGLLTHDFAPPT
jgi:phosphoserine phosphatase RsbU/P